MKNALSLLMVIFLIGISTANVKSYENLSLNNSTLACWSMGFSFDPITHDITVTGSPVVLMTSGEYLDIAVWDICGNLALYVHKAIGSNSNTVNKSQFASNFCFQDINGDQEYEVYVEWKANGCTMNSFSRNIYF